MPPKPKPPPPGKSFLHPSLRTTPNKAKRVTPGSQGRQYIKTNLLEMHYTHEAILYRPPLMRYNPFHPITWASFRILHQQLIDKNTELHVKTNSKLVMQAESCVRKKIGSKCRQAWANALHEEGYDPLGKLKRKEGEYKPLFIGGTFTIKPTMETVVVPITDITRDIRKGVVAILKAHATMTERDAQVCRHFLMDQERGYAKRRRAVRDIYINIDDSAKPGTMLPKEEFDAMIASE